ncbi:MAG: 4-oxalocrotonate tautomerase [Deltaproteobacteria bacterium]|nr:4-oxalocrotonate tautomerase [Deltaproteobacteria bacterium]
MPVVTVEMWEGRTVEQKRRLVRAITQAMVEHARAEPHALHVIIHEIPRQNWAKAGTLAVDQKKAPARAARGRARRR